MTFLHTSMLAEQIVPKEHTLGFVGPELGQRVTRFNQWLAQRHFVQCPNVDSPNKCWFNVGPINVHLIRCPKLESVVGPTIFCPVAQRCLTGGRSSTWPNIDGLDGGHIM